MDILKNVVLYQKLNEDVCKLSKIRVMDFNDYIKCKECYR